MAPTALRHLLTLPPTTTFARNSTRFILQNKMQASTGGLIAGVAVAGAGAYSVYRYSTSSKDQAAAKVFGNGPIFTSLKLGSVEVVNHDVKRLRFELPEGGRCGFGLTSAVLTLSKPDGHFFPVVRPYTPVSDLADQPNHIDLLVKQYPNGKASTHLHSLVPGQSLFFLAAIKGFSWTPNKYPHITLIAGGQGITPMYQLISGILKNPDDETNITLVFGVNTDEDLLFRKEFEEWEIKFGGRFKVVYAVSKAEVEGKGVRKGYVTRELLEEVLEAPKKDTKVFVCGPPGMEKALAGKGGILAELGYGKDQVHRF